MSVQELVNELGQRFLTYDSMKPIMCLFAGKKYRVMYINYFIDLKLLQLGCVLPDGVTSYRDENGFFHTSYKLRGHNIDDLEFENVSRQQFDGVISSI